MVKKSTLSKKLASYSALATAVLAVGHEADAQIIYTNLNPEVIIPSSIMYRSFYNTSAYLDLNNDGVSDYKFTASGQYGILTSNTFGSSYDSSASIKASGLNTNLINRVVAPYKTQIPTSVPNSWTANLQMAKMFATYRVSFGSVIRSTYTGFGPFFGVSSVYAALKFSNKGNTYYGWARVYTVGARQFAIADYAYNATPGAPIAAGDVGCNFAPITPVININTDTLQSSSANKYQWYFEDTLLVGDTLNYFVPSATGYYSVTTIDSNGCLSQSTALYDTVNNISTGLISSKTNGSLQDNQVSVYSYDKRLYVTFTDDNYIGSPLKIYNTSGEEVYSTTLTTGQTEIDMKDFAAGIYIVEMAGKTSSVIKKVMVE